MANSVAEVIDELQTLVDILPVQLKHFTKKEFDHKPLPEKWSKKEIMGHLCDSCFNNLQRIIRVQYEDKPLIIYDQDAWVKNQDIN